MTAPNLNQVLVDSAIWVLWSILNAVDVVLVAFQGVFGVVFRKPSVASKGCSKPRVVVVGASFAGLETQHELSRHSNELDITIIDYKTYFEYTPGILRCFVDPSHFSSLSCSLSALNETGTRVITGEVVNVNVSYSNNVDRNEVTLKDGRKIPYDYLVLAAGSTYPGLIKATPTDVSLAQRQRQWDNAADELDKAQTVAIVGAGAVGVELAGEIRDKYPAGTKRILLIDMAATILPGMEPASIQYATKWLKDNDVEMYLGSPLKKIDAKFIKFQEGHTVPVDIVFKCVGAAPASGLLAASPLSKALKGPKKAVVVNDSLQVVGFPHIFSAGDMCHHGSSNELKLAHTASLNAQLVAENIIRMVSQSSIQHNGNGHVSNASNQSLLTYPSGVVGGAVTPKIYCLSLGKYDATLGFNQLVLNGSIGAIMKWLIEWTQVAAAAQRPVGFLFWTVAHCSSNLLGRTILASTTTAATSTLATKSKKS